VQRFKNILAVVNSEAPDSPAFHQAVALAVENNGRLKLVDVVRDFGWLKRTLTPSYDQLIEKMMEDKTRKLEEKAAGLRVRGVNVTTCVLHGRSSTEITRQVLVDGHDVVLKDAKGSNGSKGYFGATGMRLLRQCPCPVWMTRPDANQCIDCVLAAIDVTAPDAAHADLNRKIIELAQSLAKREEAKLKVVHAWSIYGATLLRSHMDEEEFEKMFDSVTNEARQRFDQFGDAFGLTSESPEVFLCPGDAGNVIPELIETEGVDLIVMGTVARGGISGAIMGNTAELILNRVQCSVLAVKPDDFMSHISPA
jgi:universal stress protein E